jgi:nicotinamidase/pyrazinamidase
MKKNYTLNKSDALLVTDIQVDFLPGGALPILGGDKIIPTLNQYIGKFSDVDAHVLASRDWHPNDHISFTSRGGPWPAHCVQNTNGAKFHPGLELPEHTVVISKATNPDEEGYSAFDDTELGSILKQFGVTRLFVGGLATDYCVVNTVVDAREMGFDVVVLLDASRGINAEPGDVERAIVDMVKAGAEIATVERFAETVDTLSVDELESDVLEEKPSERTAMKKKARMRSRGSNRQIQPER